MKTHGRTSFRRGWPWLWYDGILNVENLNNQILVSLTRKSSGKYSPPAPARPARTRTRRGEARHSRGDSKNTPPPSTAGSPPTW